jgi:hypothetical protein
MALPIESFTEAEWQLAIASIGNDGLRAAILQPLA